MVNAADSVTAGEVGNRWMFKKDSSERLLYGTISVITVVSSEVSDCFVKPNSLVGSCYSPRSLTEAKPP